jgi:polyhydroxyalkanoate synthase subunit PhaC
MTAEAVRSPEGAAGWQEAALRSYLGRMTGGISPASVMQAYTDWLLHLAASPAKQASLMHKAIRKASRLAVLQRDAWLGNSATCIEPLPQDRRFNAPEWRTLPYSVWYQAFLLSQQWWWNATTGVRGVTQHHEDVVTFITRQLLDIFSPSNFVATNPEVWDKTMRTGGLNLVQGAQNWWHDTALQLANRRPEGSEKFVVGKDVAITPGKVVYQNELIELIQYAPQTPTVFAEPILIVPSWIMKYYILDLSPGNSLVKYLVGEGHTVFAISWRNPGSSDFNLGLEDYLKLGPIAALTEIRRLLPKAAVHTLGYCLGGTLLAIAAAFLFGREQNNPLKRAIRSATLLAAELDFSAPGELSLFIDESQIAYIEDIMREQGYLDGKQMAGAFTLLNSKDLVWSKMIRNYLMGVRQPMSDLMAWNSDATRLPYRMHSENLRRLYLRNELASGSFQVDGKPVALTDIRVPMFVVAAERDHISPWHSVYKTHMLVDTELTFLLTSGGHNVGVVNPPGTAVSSYRVTRHATSGKYVDPDTWLKSTPLQQGSWWPTWNTWLRGHTNEQSTRRVKATPLPAVGRNGQLLVDAPGSYVFES